MFNLYVETAEQLSARTRAPLTPDVLTENGCALFYCK